MRFRIAALFVLVAALAMSANCASLHTGRALSGAFFIGASPGAPQEKPAAEQAKTAAPSKADGDYVGSDTCIACHEDQNRRFKNTVMGKVFAHPRTPVRLTAAKPVTAPAKAT
jgi:cytochrome c5